MAHPAPFPFKNTPKNFFKPETKASSIFTGGELHQVLNLVGHVIKLVIKIRSDELTTLMSQPPEDDDGDGIGDLNAVQKMLGTIREVFRDAVFQRKSRPIHYHRFNR